MKSLYRLLLISMMVSASTAAPIYTWIPWYGIPGAKTVLDTTYNNIAVKDVISTVGLQLWNIRSDGTLYNWNTTDATIRELVDFVKARDMKVGMAIVNIGTDETGYDSFDWTIVRPAAYGPNQATFITNILNIVDSLDLDDVNLDLEGEDQQGGPWTQADKDGYAGFVALLADSLHARGKTLSIATYSTNTYGAPNPSWWESWKGKVDQIHTMGYNTTYWSAPEFGSYSAKQEYADNIGYTGEEVLFGMPMWVDKWAGGNDNTGISNIDNLNFIKNCLPNNQGITLWDIHHPTTQFEGTSTKLWTQDSVWTLLHAIATDTPQDPSNCPDTSKPEWLLEDFSSVGKNFEGGVVAASSDYWSHSTDDRASKSTLVYNLEKNYDMVAQMGTWGDIGVGYRKVDETGINNFLHFNVTTRAQNTGGDAYGGIVFNMLPVDPTIDPTAAAWEVAKIGVDRDLSNSQEFVVGAKCDKDQTFHVGFESKADLEEGTHGAWRKEFTCSGEWEDYRVNWNDLTEPSWGSTTLEFDPAKVLRVSVIWINSSHPGELEIALAGFGLDSSVIDYRQNDINTYKPDVKVSLKQSSSTLKNIQDLQVNAHSWSLKASDNLDPNATLGVYNLLGEVQFEIQLNNKHHGQWATPLPQGNYLFHIKSSQGTFTKHKSLVSP